MIGQERIKEKFNRFKELPRFIIFNGIKGCGKKTLAKELASSKNMELVIIGTKIDDIRGMINIANEYDTELLFFIDDGNKLSLGALNTLLKITEEAPNNTHIILSVENKDLLLPTIISRGEVFNFQNYTLEQHKQYIKDNNLVPENIASTFNQDWVDKVYPNFYYYSILPITEGAELGNLCSLISSSIREANGANAFKITEKIKVKEEQQGYDLFQFIWVLKNTCNNNMLQAAKLKKTQEFNYQLEYIKILTELQFMLNNPLFNKSYILDKLVIDFKGVYFE